MNNNKRNLVPDVTFTKLMPPDNALLDGPDALILIFFSVSKAVHENDQLLFPLVCQLHDVFQVF